MKKIVIGLSTALLSACLIALPVSAIRGGGFTDADRNGICDNQQTAVVTNLAATNLSANSVGQNFIDTDQDGICDNRANGSGKNFVDENNDGICDNAGNQATGQGNRNGSAGQNFIDTDQDGVCDNRTNGSCARQNNGR